MTLTGYLHGLRGASELRQKLNLCDSLDGCIAILDEWYARAPRAA